MIRGGELSGTPLKKSSWLSCSGKGLPIEYWDRRPGNSYGEDGASLCFEEMLKNNRPG